MSVVNDPRYRALADVALGVMGASATADMEKAIAAQWQCEQPANAWPPVHNNPGNVTKGAMASVGVITAGATSSPGIGFLSQFATPEDGARAYATLITAGHRYQSALADARAGDGAAFLKAITAAGYGTRYTCAISAYKAAGGVTPASTSTSPTGILTSFDQSALTAFQAKLASIGIPTDPTHVITPTEAQAIVTSLYGLTPSDDRYNGVVGYFANKAVKDASQGGTVQGIDLNPLDAAATAINAVATTLAQVPAALGNIAAHLGELLFILVLLLMGLYLLAKSEDLVPNVA